MFIVFFFHFSYLKNHWHTCANDLCTVSGIPSEVSMSNYTMWHDPVGNSSAIADSQSCRRQLSFIPHFTFTSLTKLRKDDCKELGTVYLEWNFHVNISDLLLICRVIWENMILLYKVYIRLNKITAAIIHCSILRAKFCGMFVIFTKTVI